MSNFQDALLLKQLNETMGKKVVFWGASSFLLKFLQNNNIEKYNIIGIIDSNENIKNSILVNKKVFLPQDVPVIPDYVIFSIKNNNLKIYNQISKWIKTNWQNTELLPNIFIQNDIESLASNKIYVISNGKRIPVVNIPGINFIWQGKNSIVEIEANPLPKFSKCIIRSTNNSFVKIGASSYDIKNVEIEIQEDSSSLLIGKDFQMQGGKIWITGESNLSIEIGDDCMFSHGIIIRASDYHTVLSKNTNKPINQSRGIKIGNHVWICQNSTILKNSVIPNNCIVGASSLINKVFREENTVISGIPAKVVKKDIDWDREVPNKIV